MGLDGVDPILPLRCGWHVLFTTVHLSMHIPTTSEHVDMDMDMDLGMNSSTNHVKR